MLKWLGIFQRNNHEQNLFLNSEESKNPIDEDNVHIKHIRSYGETLQKTHLPLSSRLQAAESLGIISFTGGPEAANCAQAYIEDLVHFLNQTLFTEKDKITVLQSLSGICYNNSSNQSFVVDLQILITLVAILNTRNTHHMTIKVKFWACYLLNVLCCNNIPVIQRLNKVRHLHPSLIHLSELSWFGWPKNYAQVLIYLLGFEKQNRTL
ncbi:armadillo-like helical domain-containing protein 2 [Narcine bancroftii]|uniref:armadillo-like helical domain-containing protein 2 n=1 Tax=Narcine bancroftii TaxID=1343680 RepID=UPI0038319046